MFDILKDNIRWEVGRGNKINFWYDIWCGETALKNRFPNIFAIDHNKDILVADAFCVASNCVVALDRNLNDWEMSEYICSLELMADVKLIDKSDTLIFSLFGNWKKKWQIHSSLYKHLTFPNDLNDGVFSLQSWKANAPPKISFFAWEAAKEQIFTIDIMKRGTILVNRCFLCKGDAKSCNHMLLWCPFSIKLWSLVRNFWLGKVFPQILLQHTLFPFLFSGFFGKKGTI